MGKLSQTVPATYNADMPCMRRENSLRHLYYLTWSVNPVTLHEICLVVIMQMYSKTALVDLHYIASSLCVINNPSPGAESELFYTPFCLQCKIPAKTLTPGTLLMLITLSKGNAAISGNAKYTLRILLSEWLWNKLKNSTKDPTVFLTLLICFHNTNCFIMRNLSSLLASSSQLI